VIKYDSEYKPRNTESAEQGNSAHSGTPVFEKVQKVQPSTENTTTPPKKCSDKNWGLPMM